MLRMKNILIPLSIKAASVVVSECVEFVRCLLLGVIVFGFAFEHDQNVSELYIASVDTVYLGYDQR